MQSANKYQEEIFEFFAHGSGNAVINAKAGSGKTYTAVKALDFIDRTKKVLFIAFNKDIVRELSIKVGDRKNTDILTYHALGLKLFALNYKDFTIDTFKYASKLNELLDDNSAFLWLDDKQKKQYRTNVLSLVDYYRLNFLKTEEDFSYIINKYGIETVADEVPTAQKLLDWGRNTIKNIDFTDMEWLICEHGIESPKCKYDWIIIDEAQDSSPLQQTLVMSCLKKNGRFCCIGDNDQTINAWCGGDEEAFNKFLSMPNVHTFDLPICYRCAKSIVEKAQEIVPEIEAREDAPIGSVNYNVSPYEAKDGDMILCRNTVPLTTLFNEFIKHNISAYIRGAEIGNELISLIEKTDFNTLSADFSYNGVIPTLYRDFFKFLDNFIDEHNISIEDALKDETVATQYSKVKTIELLSEGQTNTAELEQRISNIFRDDETHGICLSTIHKAKGLEADNVFILCPSLMPSKTAKQEWEIKAEQNLIYVAITRAKKSLNYISETYFSIKKGYSDAQTIEEDLNEKRRLLATLNTGEIQTPLPIKKIGSSTPNKVGAKKFSKFF